MQLILKQPSGKPPCIGVWFNFENDAVTMNKSWAEYNQPFTYELLLEPSHKLHMTMRRDSHFSERYTMEYDPVALLKFLHTTRDSKQYTLAHLLCKDDKFVVPRTRAQNAKLLFNIDSIVIAGMHVERP